MQHLIELKTTPIGAEFTNHVDSEPARKFPTNRQVDFLLGNHLSTVSHVECACHVLFKRRGKHETGMG